MMPTPAERLLNSPWLLFPMLAVICFAILFTPLGCRMVELASPPTPENCQRAQSTLDPYYWCYDANGARYIFDPLVERGSRLANACGLDLPRER
jgi:hypothetical protein